MTSMREERLQERVAEIRPQLAKAREIAEKAETENREMTAEEQKAFDEIEAQRWSVASQRPRSELHLASSPRTVRPAPPAGCGQCRLFILQFRCPERDSMQHKSVPLLIKGADDDSGTFTGLASVFDNLDHDGEIVRRGAFSKSLDSGTPIPLIWMHKADDPRWYVGDVVETTETDDGLAIKGRFDPATEFRQVGLPKHTRAAECQV